MPNLEITTEQIIALVKQLPPADQQTVLSALNTVMADPLIQPDAETQAWLEADLAGDLPPYEWGAAGMPAGKPVTYVPGQGLVVEEGKTVG